MDYNRKNILIVHPEGSFNLNSNLTAIIEILTEENFFVEILCPRFNFYQYPINEFTKIKFYEPKKPIRINVNSYCLIIGIDTGILEASQIARCSNTPLGYISYEITFKDECGSMTKKLEKKACKNLSFAVSQDNLRAKNLSEQNSIPFDKIYKIPVAGRKPFIGAKNYLLHHQLGINQYKKIAFLMGSISTFTMADEIIKSTLTWPENWVLIVNDRVGNAADMIKNYKNYPKVYFLKNSFKSFNDLSEIMNSVEIGLAFYNATFENIYFGKNIKYIGLSSGKIATFLQSGIPVIINNIGQYNDLIDSFKVGFTVPSPSNIKNILEEFDFLENENMRQRCFDLFEEKLSLDKNIKELILHINQITTVPITKSNNYIDHMMTMHEKYHRLADFYYKIYIRKRKIKFYLNKLSTSNIFKFSSKKNNS